MRLNAECKLGLKNEGATTTLVVVVGPLQKGHRSSLHANGEPVLGRRHKCENELLTIYGKSFKLKH